MLLIQFPRSCKQGVVGVATEQCHSVACVVQYKLDS